MYRFTDDDDQQYQGNEARRRWRSQSVKCDCGAYADDSRPISGTSNGVRSVWLSCPYHRSALGTPLVVGE